MFVLIIRRSRWPGLKNLKNEPVTAERLGDIMFKNDGTRRR